MNNPLRVLLQVTGSALSAVRTTLPPRQSASSAHSPGMSQVLSPVLAAVYNDTSECGLVLLAGIARLCNTVRLTP